MLHKPYILVVRQLGGIGDVLMMSCLYRGLRETYPKHTIKLVAPSIYLGGALIDVAEHNPFIDEIHIIEPYDCTTQHTKEVWAKYFENAPNIENELIWKMADKAFDMNTPCVDFEWNTNSIDKPRYQVWCDAANIVPSSYAPVYKIRPDELAEAKGYAAEHWEGKKVVGVGLAAADKKRALGLGKLEDICHMLQQAGVHPVTIDPTCKIDGVDYLINKRIRELMPLMHCMDTVISVDSGLLHMAGTVGTPVIGVFGPTDYRMRMGNYLGSAIDSRQLMPCTPCWYGYPCTKDDGRHGIKPYECLNKIQPEVVVEETLRWVLDSRKVDH
jgi:ADP-heptose:LPS heptosyltransferase